MRFVESWTGQTWAIFTEGGTRVGLLRCEPDGKVRWTKLVGDQGVQIPAWTDKTYDSIEQAKEKIRERMFIEWL